MPKFEQEPQPKEPISMEDIISPRHLKMISEASGGFTFQPDHTLPFERKGYTDKNTGVIYYNPIILHGDTKRGVPPMDKDQIMGFAYHEAGHHAQEVLAFDRQLFSQLSDPDAVPPSFRGSIDMEMRYLEALNKNLLNSLVDMWLESYMGREPYRVISHSINELQSAKGEDASLLANFSKYSMPQKFLQILLRHRTDESMKRSTAGVGGEVVSQALNRVHKSGAMRVLQNIDAHSNYFATDKERQHSIYRKVEAYRGVFLPVYNALVEREMQDEEERIMQEKGEELSPTEKQLAAENVLEKLEKEGSACTEAQAPSAEEMEESEALHSMLQGVVEDRNEGRVPESRYQPYRQKSGIETLREIQEELERKNNASKLRGLMDAHQAREESIKAWIEIKERFRDEIESLASTLSEFFCQDRRQKIEFLKREGEIVPGLEYETIAAMISGDLDPSTKMKIVRNVEFLETETEFVIDASSSMSGKKIKESVEIMVVITEAFKRTKEVLEAENLLGENEDALRIGVTKYSVRPVRITPLSEPISDRKEIKIIQKASEIGGGTDEVDAVKMVYEDLSGGKDNVIKLLILLTDGYGNVEGIRPIMQLIESDDQVSFMAIGVGDSDNESATIARNYTDPLNNKKEGNVLAIGKGSFVDALPEILQFLKKEILRRGY